MTEKEKMLKEQMLKQKMFVESMKADSASFSRLFWAVFLLILLAVICSCSKKDIFKPRCFVMVTHSVKGCAEDEYKPEVYRYGYWENSDTSFYYELIDEHRDTILCNSMGQDGYFVPCDVSGLNDKYRAIEREAYDSGQWFTVGACKLWPDIAYYINTKYCFH